MNRIKNLKIAHKILAFVAFIMLFISITGFAGVYFTDNSTKNMVSMYRSNLLPIHWLNQINTNFTKIESNLFEMTAVKTEIEVQKLYEEILDLRAKDNRLIDLYLKTKISPYEKNEVAKYKIYLKSYRSLQENVIEFRKNEQKRNAFDYILNHIQDIDNVHNSIKNLINYNLKDAELIQIQNSKDSVSAISLISLIILGALVSSGFIALFLSKIISEPINNVVRNLNEMAKGNLAISELKINSKDETGQLASSLNLTVKNLRNLINSVANTIADISASSEEMSASAEQTAQGSQQTANSSVQLAEGAQSISTNVEQGATTINKMNRVIQCICEEAKVISKLGNDTEMNANKGSRHVQNAVGKIDNIKTVAEDISVTVTKLGKLSSEIETIVDLIKGIASQTNLLALNAAIEAARAGEHGKGFAVVAEEVKKLAGQSAEATDQINQMIKEIQKETGIAVNKMNKATNEVEEGVTIVNEAGKALENIIEQVKTANIKIQGITKQIDGVANNSDEIVRMVENISAVTEQTAASAQEISSITEEQTASMEEISASSQALAQIADTLNRQVSVFKI